MRATTSLKICILAIAALPFLGPTCVEEKTIELTFKGDSEATFHATGTTNVDLGSSTYDVRNDLDIDGALRDNDIDPSKVLTIRMRALLYRISTPDPVASRQIVNGEMTVQFTGRPEQVLATGFSAPAGAATDWIDVTGLLQSGGVAELNAFFARLLGSLQSGNAAAAAPTEATFDWSGTSTPTDQATDFFWKAKMEVTVIYAIEAEVPDF